MKSKYDEQRLCAMARHLGRKGFGVTEAAARMQISTTSFARYERKYPKFKAAAEKIRKNSAEWAALRFARLLGRSEESLVKALANVRARKERILREHAAKFGRSE